MLYVGVVIVGLAIGADLPVSLALAAEEAPEGAKGRMVALSGVLWMLGIGVVVVLSIIVGAYRELGARLLYAQLLVVSLVVLVLRSRMKESTEWTAARIAAIAAPVSERVDLGSLRRLLAPPLLAPLLATRLFYAVWNLGAVTFPAVNPWQRCRLGRGQ